VIHAVARSDPRPALASWGYRLRVWPPKLTCFHTWRVRAVEGEWRVAAQMVERFEDLNENAASRFATPDEGLNR
jgi:hypothetical protein